MGTTRQTRDHASSIFSSTLVVSFCVPMAACLSNPLGQIHCCIPCQINIAKQIIKLFHLFIFGAGNALATASQPFAESGEFLLLGSNKQTNQQQLGICLLCKNFKSFI
jgi:hypothetical protein